MTISELQDALRIGRTKAYKLVSSNEIKSLRIGGTIRIPKEYVVEYLLSIGYNKDAEVSAPVAKEV